MNPIKIRDRRNMGDGSKNWDWNVLQPNGAAAARSA